MANEQDPPEPEPIDVEFVPADQDEIPKKPKSSGPGWIGLISAGVLAALGGGAIGVVASGTEGRYAQAAEVAVDISKLEEFDRGVTTQITLLEEQLRAAETRLSIAREQIDAGVTASGEAMALLRADLDQLNARYMALLGTAEPLESETEDGAANAGEEAETPEGETPDEPLPRPDISLAALMDRLNAIESAGSNGEATPQDLARTVASLQERAEQLETADRQFADLLDARAELVEELGKELETVETGLTTLSDYAQTLEATQQSDVQALIDLTADVNALRETLNERLSNLDSVEITEEEQDLVQRADRVLALSALEASMEEGSDFSTELEALALKLPANSNVSALRRMAESGAPNLEALKAELVRLKPEIAKAGIPEKPSGNWAWVNDILSGVVSMREEGTSGGETASQKVQDAISALEGRDLPTAIESIKLVKGAQAELLGDWLKSAERRQRVDTLMVRLRDDVLEGEAAQ